MGFENVIDYFLSDTRLKIKSVRQVLLPLTISSWIVGMGIIEFPIGEPWPYASAVYAIVLLTVHSLTAVVTLINIDLFVLAKTRMGITIYQILIYGNICMNISGTFFAWMRIKNMKIIIDRLEESDAKMEKMGISRDYRIIYIKELMALIFQLFIIILIVVIIVSDSPMEIAIWIKMATLVAVYYPLFIISVGDFSFVILVRFMNMRFEQLNKYLLSMSTCTDDSPQHKRVLENTSSKSHNSDDHSAIKAAREYHHELVKISSMINDTFGVQALLSMTVSFVRTTSLVYNVCNLLWSEPGQAIMNRGTKYAACWLGFYILRIVIINSACAKTSAAAKKTGLIVCHLHEPSTKKAFRDEIRDFTLQLTQYSLTFTACGLFTLNYELIKGMIGSITTYLVILIQMGELPPTEVIVNMTIGSF